MFLLYWLKSAKPKYPKYIVFSLIDLFLLFVSFAFAQLCYNKKSNKFYYIFIYVAKEHINTYNVINILFKLKLGLSYLYLTNSSWNFAYLYKQTFK